MLAAARTNVPSGDFRQGDLTQLPVPGQHVDLVVCSLALAHVRDLAPVFAEFARVLRPGGHLVISDSRMDYPLVVALPAGGHGYLPHHKHATSEYLTAALPAGLQVRHCEEMRSPCLDPADAPPRRTRPGHPSTSDARPAPGGLPGGAAAARRSSGSSGEASWSRLQPIEDYGGRGSGSRVQVSRAGAFLGRQIAILGADIGARRSGQNATRTGPPCDWPGRRGAGGRQRSWPRTRRHLRRPRAEDASAEDREPTGVMPRPTAPAVAPARPAGPTSRSSWSRPAVVADGDHGACTRQPRHAE
jgi:hypothetical protein